MNTNLERCPQHAWHLEQEIKDSEKLNTEKIGIVNDRIDTRVEKWIFDENHRIEALNIALRSWEKEEDSDLKESQIAVIKKELEYEYSHNINTYEIK